MVYGHQEAKKSLITMISRIHMRWHQKYIKEVYDEYLLQPMKILLCGPSGYGKSHLMHSLQQIEHFPLVSVDATDLNPTGASGGITSEKLKGMIRSTAKDAMVAMPYSYQSFEGAIDKTVVYVDEINKLGTSFESSGNWNKHVQSNFLTLFDNKDEFAGVSFVFAGVFNDVDDKPKSPINQIGFFAQHKEERGELIDQKVLAAGLIPELVGRMTAIVELDTFTEDDFYNILTEKLLQKKYMDLAAYGIFEQDLSENTLRQLAKDAKESGQGVRWLQRALDKHFLDVEFEADVDKIIFGGM